MGDIEVNKKRVKMHGKVKRMKEEVITLLGREVLVRINEYESGVQRCFCFFTDKNRTYLTQQNMILRKRIQELENKLKKK